MNDFMDENFLLSNDTARLLYQDHASKMPIVDYHCHINPKEIYEDLVYDNLSQVWLGGDHYKWRAMRSNGIDERFITGNDTGYDAIYGHHESGVALGALLGSLEGADCLPKTVIYSLNPNDNAQIDAILGCFQSPEIPGKMQHGSAWWFNDSKTGVIAQMTSLANNSVLANFIGMLTDSRSFLSYTRHEYFRRILCNMLGQWVENGEYPADMETLGKMVEDISYNNAVAYFGFDIGAENNG